MHRERQVSVPTRIVAGFLMLPVVYILLLAALDVYYYPSWIGILLLAIAILGTYAVGRTALVGKY